MSSRVVKAFRVVKCLTKNSSSVFSREAKELHPSCNRIATALVNGRTSICTGSNGVSQITEDQKICIESTVFTENVSNLSTSIGLTHNPECLKPALVHRSYLTAHASTLKQQHKDNDQLSFLGLQTTKRFLGELLLEHFPHLTTQELWDIQNGILEDHVLAVAENLQLSQYIAYDCTTNTSTATIQSLMAVIAVIYIHEGTEKTRQFLQDYFISQLNENEIQQVIKLQHPKYILRSLSQKHRHEPVRPRLLRKKTSKDESAAYKVGAFKEDKCLAIGMASTSELAEKKACQNALRKIYPDDVRGFNFSYEAEDFESEDGIDLGLVTSRQRVITLDKEDKAFGFNIKGGEKKRLKNKDWLVYNYFTPIFISSLQPDSLADRLGSLRVGDVILAVNDKSLVGVDHATAVKVLQQATGTATLTVQHSNEVLLTDRVETEFKKMKQRKRLAELTSEVWAEWHQAQADKHPEKYADVLNLKENVVAQ